jgi:hypothetical protein
LDGETVAARKRCHSGEIGRVGAVQRHVFVTGQVTALTKRLAAELDDARRWYRRPRPDEHGHFNVCTRRHGAGHARPWERLSLAP